MKSKELLRPLALAVIVTTGFAAVWGIVSLWGIGVANEVFGPARGGENLQFRKDGTPLRFRWSAHGAEYGDLQGNPIPEKEHGGTAMLSVTLLPAERSTDHREDAGWQNRLRCFGDSFTPKVYWYLAADGRPDARAYFVGYDRESKYRIGYLGTAGFRNDVPPVEERIPFAGNTTTDDVLPQTTVGTRYPGGLQGRLARHSVAPWDVYIIGSDARIYHADLQRRTLRICFDSPEMRSAALIDAPDSAAAMRVAFNGAVAAVVTAPDDDSTSSHLAIRTDKAVIIVDQTDRVVNRFPMPETLQNEPFHFAETKTGEGLMFRKSPDDMLAVRTDYDLHWVTPKGGHRQATTTLTRVDSWPKILPYVPGIVMPAPAALAVALAIVRPPQLLDEGLCVSYSAGLAQAFSEFAPALAIALAIAACLAVLCYRRQVHFGMSRRDRVAWPVFVLLFGLPGWVAYRFGRTWPVLQSCPTCGASVPQDRPECVHCETEFAMPAPTGAEVFA